MNGQTKTERRASPELAKRKEKMYWYTWNLISLAWIAGAFIAVNLAKASIYVAIPFVLGALIIIDLLEDFNLFEYISSILVAFLYDILWAASLKIGLNIYSILLNVAVGVMLALLLWVFYGTVMPSKGAWNKKILTKDIKIKGAPFFYLILTGLWAFVMTFTLLPNFSFLLFILGIVIFIGLIYFTLDYYDAAKKYVEKGEKHGNPKPKRRWRKASARPR